MTSGRPIGRSFRTSDGLRLSYVTDDYTDPWQSNDTLVLLHAAQGCARRFYAWVPHLARQFRVVRLDLRGHGESEVPGPNSTLDVDRLVADVIELIDHLGSERVHLAGSSAGAMIAMRASMNHPHRVQSLASFAATAGMRDTAFDFEAWAAAIKAKGMRKFLSDSIWHRFDVDHTDPGLVEWWLDLAASSNADLDYAARFVSVMVNLDLRDGLERIACPTLSVVPGSDPEHSLAEYEILRERIRNIEFVVFRGFRHNITDAVPDRCAKQLRDFLDGLRT
ncbi:MAG: alpha/beta hydrolase [Gemmatimonadetes bacterium]|nr:alpha/beta hydrolase [Gemmatimonadota bacterium]